MIADISGMTKPASLVPVIRRIRQYIEAMAYAQKPVGHVDMYADDYDLAMRNLNKEAKEQSRPEIHGLSFGSIPVNRSIRK